MSSKFFSRPFARVVAAVAVVAALVCSGVALASPEGHTVVIAGSDFQGSSNSVSSNNVTQIINAMKSDGIAEPDGLVFSGDYNLSLGLSGEESNASIEALKSTIRSAYPSIGENMVLSAGNHEEAMDEGIDVSPYGNNDTAGYGVFVIHEDNFPWSTNNGDTATKTVVKQTASDLMGYLNQKIKAGYTKPIFVLCHVPLHANSRSINCEGKYSEYLVNVLNQGAAAGLNIVFLYGHCHDQSSEPFHGGEAVYYAPGDTMQILKTTSYESDDTVSKVIGFHYMNAGYTGYFGGKDSTALTMSCFDFTGSQMTITRYNKNGVYALKAAGTSEPYAYTYASPRVVQLSQTVNTSRLISRIEDSDIPVETVSLSCGSLVMEPGDAEQLTVTTSPIAATDKTITWTTGNSAVATVSASGEISAVAPGTTTITAAAVSGAEATCTVKVLSDSEIVRVTGVSLNETSLELFEGDERALVATLAPANPTKNRVRWSTSDESVATVDASGNVLCTGVGTATVTATTVDGGFTATCRVKVNPTAATGVALDKSELSLVTGDSETLVATLQPAGATNKNVTWSSSDTSVATVSAAGEVTGTGDGTATITATTADGGFTATCQVTVRTAGVYVTPSELVIPGGESYQLSAEVFPASSSELKWHCYYGGSVTGSGLFTASVFTYTANDGPQVQADCGGKQGICKVSIPKPTDVSWVIADGVLEVRSDVPSYTSASAAPWASYASKVTSIVIGSGVSTVGANAFSSCVNASEITVPASAALDESALAGLTNIKINGTAAHDCAVDGHVAEALPAVEATCVKAGLTAGSRCSVCGDTIVAQKTVPALGHDWGDWVVDREATCTAKGSEQRVCARDANHVEVRDIDATGHDVVADPAVEATCTEAGLTAGEHCSRCDYKVAQQTVPALGHDIVADPAVEATCTEAGLTAGEHCSRCEYKVARQTVPALGHALIHHDAKAATTTEVGWGAYDACERCDYSTYNEIPALESPDEPKPDPEPEPEPKPDPDPEPAPAPTPSAAEQEAEANNAAIAAGFVGTEATVAKAITSAASDEGPKGTAFGKLKAKSSKTTKSSIKLTWTKVAGATKYLIYGNKCGKGKKYQLIASATSKSYIKKKLKKGSSYKFLVMAVDAQGRVISVSKTIHVVTKGGKSCNAKSVKTAAKKGKVLLRKGKTFKLKAKAVASSGKLAMKRHRAIKYESTNKTVATVTSKGTIKAKGKGTCFVYAYAQNGVFAKVKVTVR